MGQIKQFAVELAQMVYDRKMKDRDIIETFKARGFDVDWIKDQIIVVRNEPQIYRTMGGSSD